MDHGILCNGKFNTQNSGISDAPGYNPDSGGGISAGAVQLNSKNKNIYVALDWIESFYV